MNGARRYLAFLLAASLVLFVAACSGGGSGSKDDASDGGSASVSLNGQLTAVLQDSLTQSTPQQSAKETASPMAVTQTVPATLVATDSYGAETPYPWSVTITTDTDVQGKVTISAVSNKTIVILPGTYDFELTIGEGTSQKYYGATDAPVTLNDGDQLSLTLTIRPVIGNVDTTVVTTSETNDFSFYYPEMCGLAAPSLEVTTQRQTPDVGPEVTETFILDTTAPCSGEAFDQHMLMQFEPPGSTYSINIKLYDGAQIGKSLGPAVLVAGEDLTVDLVPLHAETSLVLDEATGTVDFSFVVPPEVVAEVQGGLPHLVASYKITGPAYTGTPDPLEAPLSLALDPGSGNYLASATGLPGFQFGNISLDLLFQEDTGYTIAQCTVTSITLSTNGSSETCNISLFRRGTISGHLLAVVGINVFDTGLDPVGGAMVSIVGGDTLGLTGGGGFGAPGYLKTMLTAGTYTFRAKRSGMYGETTVTLSPLQVTNVDITLDTPLPLTSNVLLLGQETFGGSTYVEGYLAPFGFDSLTFYNNQLGIPTLAELQAYDAVFVWTDYASQDNTALGNVLADYVDGGGAVVTASYTSSCYDIDPPCSFGDWAIHGRWETDGYAPFLLGTNLNVVSTLGTVFEPSHPIMGAVNSLQAHLRGDPALAPGSVALANWNDGTPLVALNAAGTVVAMSFFPADDTGDLQGDFDDLVANALWFLIEN